MKLPASEFRRHFSTRIVSPQLALSVNNCIFDVLFVVSSFMEVLESYV